MAILTGISMTLFHSISLPYDHTYHRVYEYGIYTNFTSKVLPLHVTWYKVRQNTSSVVTSVWVSRTKTSHQFSVSIQPQINKSLVTVYSQKADNSDWVICSKENQFINNYERSIHINSTMGIFLNDKKI